ncbi:uncharacterized protein BO72DRAFT_463739 [Aspergillus fijiensis CBS 313.89]|uniref:Uncharacterized protein n=1 Tax=Aspergillus fijiensis CBS 313.89 TaxID=1448319 RepID=A0A8G1VSZ9_9EURO|nr:uncharacterized protein BO72DRAFT_463739 [Aspergillus fijiensis CBS 313.89]RAK71537.1 hypothetical protein BO72DRAFT_463739 [Aspergillus fijiensis CBS 313.89]
MNGSRVPKHQQKNGSTVPRTVLGERVKGRKKRTRLERGERRGKRKKKRKKKKKKKKKKKQPRSDNGRGDRKEQGREHSGKARVLGTLLVQAWAGGGFLSRITMLVLNVHHQLRGIVTAAQVVG